MNLNTVRGGFESRPLTCRESAGIIFSALATCSQVGSPALDSLPCPIENLHSASARAGQVGARDHRRNADQASPRAGHEDMAFAEAQASRTGRSDARNRNRALPGRKKPCG